MSDLEVLTTGIAFGESPRWGRDGRLWFADWAAQEVLAVDLAGNSERIVRVDFFAFPMCIDWLPDGRLLIVAPRDGHVLRREPDGSLVTHADIRGLAGEGHPWNEIVVDGRGNAYINNQGFEFPGGEFSPGTVAMLTPDGAARLVADGLAFPNGMAVTPDNSTLIVAESYAKMLTAFDIAADGSLSEGRLWRTSATVPRTGFASMPRARCGMRTCQTSAACGFVKEARSSSGSTTIAAASHALSEDRTGRRCSSSPRSGGGPSTWLTEGARAKC